MFLAFRQTSYTSEGGFSPFTGVVAGLCVTGDSKAYFSELSYKEI
jgi:hypothetical protein